MRSKLEEIRDALVAADIELGKLEAEILLAPRRRQEVRSARETCRDLAMSEVLNGSKLPEVDA